MPSRASDFLCGCRVDGVLPSLDCYALLLLLRALGLISDGAVASADSREGLCCCCRQRQPWLRQHRQLLIAYRLARLASVFTHR